MKWAEWQAFADNEDTWTNATEPGLTDVEYLHDFVLRLQFADRPVKSVYEIDFAPLMVADNPGGVFADLKDVRRFRNVQADYALIWPDPVTHDDSKAVDLAPECVRFYCQRYGRLVVSDNKRSKVAA